MFKNIFSFVLITFSFCCFAQNDTQINKYLFLKKTEKSYVFVDNKGKKSKEYTYVYLKDNGFIETIIVPPIDPEEIKKLQSTPIDTTHYEKCYEKIDYSIRKDYHVLELMKELNIIDDYYFDSGYGSESQLKDYLTRGFIKDYGFASRNGKYFALVTNKGEFLTNFKYNNPIYDDNKPMLNNYTEKGKLVTVVLDKFTGKELFATKDSLVRYWNAENYLVKNSKGKYSLTYESKRYEVPKIWGYVEDLSYKSSLFSYKRLYYENLLTIEERGFINIKGEKIEPKKVIIPNTNFYNGHCIATEIIKEEQRYDYYGRALPQKQTRVIKIINENFETIKVLDDIDGISSSGFNQYGQIIVDNKNESYNVFVIDYNGDKIIPMSKFPNRINEVYAGLYKVEDRAYPKTTESQEQENFYNQKGEKLLNQETKRISHTFEFKESTNNENYIVSYGFKMVTLDKENNVIDSYYK